MNKKILVTVGALVPLYLLATWLMGFAVERRVEQLADQGQTAMPSLRLVDTTRHGVLVSDEESHYEIGPMMKITRHYHRGWFSSVDDAAFETSGPIPAGTPIRFSLHTVIHHGPICGVACFALAGAETHMSAAGTPPAAPTRIFGDQEPITIRARFAFLGGGSATASSPPVERAQIGPGVVLSWGGLDATMHYGARQDWYDVAATMPLLRLEAPKGTFEIRGTSFTVRSKRALDMLYAGDSRVEVKRFSVGTPAQAAPFTVDDLVLTSQSQVQDRFMNVSYRLAAGAIVKQPLALSSAHMDLAWKHLGLEPLESLVVAMRSASQNQNASIAPAVRGQNVMAAIKQPLQALLVDAPEMDIDRLSLASAQGQASLTGAIRLVGVGAVDLDTPALLVQKVDAHFDLAIDEAFLSSLPGAGASTLERLQPMIDQGYMERSKGVLHTQIVFRAGQATLNGKTFNPAAMRPAAPPAPTAGPTPVR
jgi:uncharacterized protein YdgA (DUF945 family)